jgi:hypothetical protein
MERGSADHALIRDIAEGGDPAEQSFEPNNQDRAADNYHDTAARHGSSDQSKSHAHNRKRHAGKQGKGQEDEESLDDAGQDLDSADPRQVHRDVTPWKEAIGILIAINMEARSKSPKNSDKYGGKGRRGRE